MQLHKIHILSCFRIVSYIHIASRETKSPNVAVVTHSILFFCCQENYVHLHVTHDGYVDEATAAASVATAGITSIICILYCSWIISMDLSMYIIFWMWKWGGCDIFPSSLKCNEFFCCPFSLYENGHEMLLHDIVNAK